MWKPLSIVSGLLLVGAGGLMYTTVRPQYQSEMGQLEEAKKNAGLAKANKTESDDTNKLAKSDLKTSGDLVTAKTKDRDDANTLKGTTTTKVENTQKDRDAAETALKKVQAELDGLGGLEQVVADIKALEAKKAQLIADKQSTDDATKALVAHKKATDKVIYDLKIREIYQKTGTVKQGTTSRITEVSPELGFFVFATGNNSNITKNSKWDVVRGESVVAKLVVTHIEQSRSIAELVPGSLSQGDQVLPGDIVVVSAASTPQALAASVTNAAKAGPARKDEKKADGAPAAEPTPSDPFANPGGTPEPMEKPATDTPAPEPPKTENP
jgi:hypothetical protein